MNSRSKQYIPLLIIVAVVLAFGLWTASRSPELQIQNPLGENVITAEDMQINTERGVVVVGDSNSGQVAVQFPAGKTLGMSTVYYDQSQGCTFTFTKRDKLKVMHIENPNIKTARGVKVGDTLDPTIIKAYGENYGYVKKPGNAKEIDIAYGDNDGAVIFQVRDNIVTKIVLQKEPPR
jgi:hypothetical protein